MSNFELLITGSRDWTDRNVLETAVYDALHEYAPFGCITLISGACPTGADRMMEELWEDRGYGPSERYPAEWEKYGKRAGFIRNAAMVDRMPGIVLAFIKNESKGATMTADLADKKGLIVRRYLE